MMAHCLPNDRFLSLLQERRRRRAAVVSSILREPESPPAQCDVRVTSPNSRTSRQPPEAAEANLSTHYLFSSSRPQNEIQNPYPNCFEGYPKLQRFKYDASKGLMCRLTDL